MTARKHHYVPQCYLKSFVANRKRPRLYVTDRAGRSFCANPADVASERDFHRINVDGVAPDALENAFSGFESKLSASLVRSISAQSIDNDAMTDILNLISLVSIKNPRHREAFRDFQARISEKILSLVLETRERWEARLARVRHAGAISADKDVDYDQMKAFVEKGDYTIKVPTGTHLRVEMGVYNEILQIIGARNWSIYRSNPQKTGFVTTDHPSVLIWSPDQERSIFPPGFGLKGTTLLFPISNNMIMLGSFENESVVIDLDKFQVAGINTIVIAHAERQVYARDDKFNYRVGKKIKTGIELVADPIFIKKAPLYNDETVVS